MNDENLCQKVDDHETRIRILEKNETVIATKLNITNKILTAIAVMIGGSIVTFLFSLIKN